MNPLQKNIALWLVISLVFVMIYHLFNQPKTAQMDVIYSDFLSYVDKAQVTEVTIQGDNISGRLSTGKAFKTYAPKDAGVIALLKEKGVRISAKPSTMWLALKKQKQSSKRSSISFAIPRNIHVLEGGFPKDCCLWGNPEPEKPFWRGPLQGRRMSPSSASAVRIL